MAKAFSESALKSYEVFICSQVDAFLKKFLEDNLHEAEYGSGVYNLGYEFNCLMLDIMGGLCFGEEFGFVAGRGKEVLAQAHQREIRIFMTAHEPMLKRLHLDKIFFPRLWKASQALGEYAKRNTNIRISKYREGLTNSSQKGYEDIMSHLLGAGDEESGTTYSDDELLGEGILMMMAGSDTSSSALGATVFYLAHNPSALEKVQRELAEQLPTVNEIQPQHAEKCQFLRACIDEAMRMSPPAPTIIPRLVGSGGMTVGDDHLPEGVYVGVPNFTLFHDDRNFSRPHDYIPERWMNGMDAAKMENHNTAAFAPFSMGPRGCIGKHLAIKEVTFILAKFLRTFDIKRIGSNCILKPSLIGMEGKVIMAQSDVYTSLEDGPVLQLQVLEGIQH
ncbi:Nn.00g101620.m01.CDS01 [Neocucurbitaria sp. VM-36]